jgi:hypothetical protein
MVNLHYVTPKELYLYDYFIYNVHPFGLNKNLSETVPRKLPLSEIIQASDVASRAKNFKAHEIMHEIEADEKYKR